MLGNRVELLWIFIYRKYFFLLLFLSILFQVQCQIIRKSVEIPVKDYLSAPRRNSRDGKDHLYAQGSNIDSVRGFEVLSPHTPASALMFASLENSNRKVTTPFSTILPLSAPVNNPRRFEDNSLPSLFKPAVSSTNILNLSGRKDKLPNNDLFSRSNSPSTHLLEDGLNKARKGYSFSYTDPPLDFNQDPGSQAVGQEFIPIFSTPYPSLYQNSDAAIGYLNKFSNILPIAHEGVEGRNIDSFSGFSQYVTPLPLQHVTPSYGAGFQTLLSSSQPYATAGYKQQIRSDEYDQYPSRERYYDSPSLSKEINNYSQERIKSPKSRKAQKVPDQDKSEKKGEATQIDSSKDIKQPPDVPPTIGVIGWKSNTDHETSWKPTKELMNMADQHIKEDMQNVKHKPDSTTPSTPQKEEEREDNKTPSKNEEETSEEEEEGEEEEEEDGEEEEEEEGEEEESGEVETEDKAEPPNSQAPPSYENSAEGYRDHPPNSPPRYENSAESYRDPPANSPTRYENSAESYRDPPANSPPRYENSAESYRDPPANSPPRYENSAESYRDPPANSPPRYENSAESYRYPPANSPPRYENSAESYRDPPPNSPPNYENSAESYRGPPANPPPRYENSAENYREYSSQSHPKYEHSDENYRYPPSQPPPGSQSSAEKYNSQEYNAPNQNKKDPYKSGEVPHRSGEYFYDGQTLPPGPPYNPPSYAQDPRSSFGYLPPPPAFQPELSQIDNGIRQTWTPIIPTTRPLSTQENKNLAEYKSDNGRWLLNGGPILKNDFRDYNFGFGNWKGFGKDKNSNQVEDDDLERHTKQYKEERSYRKNSNDEQPDQNKNHEDDGNRFPVEHRVNRESSEETSNERANSKESPKELPASTTSEYQPPPPPPDLDEERVRNHVSDREIPRKVPTRLRYPGGGLWAKPPQDSVIDLGFVPKKVYTQTRKHNVVKHLPREAALAAASTAEEIVNAPRLREVVSHKKVQEVYEEEGYEDSGYDHGGYKKHGAKKSDSDKYDSGEHHAPADAEGEEAEAEAPGPEEAFEEHLAHLEAIPEDNKDDPAGQDSVKQVVQANEKPKVKGSWKQQKTTTNERSMAFLDEEGKGGILTQTHPTIVEGVEGKYLDVNGKRIPVIKEITDSPLKIIEHGDAVSFQRFSPPNVRTDQPEKEVVYERDFEEPKYQLPSTSGYTSQGYEGSQERKGVLKEIPNEQNSRNSDYLHFKNNLSNINTQLNLDSKLLSELFNEKGTELSPLSDYTSRNNRFSFIQPRPEKSHFRDVNYHNLQDKNKKPDDRNSGSVSPSPLSRYESRTEVNKNQFTTSDFKNRPEPTKSSDGSVKYSARFIGTKSGSPALLDTKNNLDNGRLFGALQYKTGTQSKERRSRDLTAVGVDGTEDKIVSGQFTHPKVALRAIEDKITLISRESFDRPPRSRSRTSETRMAKEYSEIVRAPKRKMEESVESKKDNLHVRLTDEDVNIRHPFLPRDGSGDIHIDYVKIRKEYDSTTISPMRKEYFKEDVEFPSVTEDPITTTTLKATTTKSKTTTEYIPEDPSQTLSRLRSNVFLSSIFQDQENKEEKKIFHMETQTTTTPKITTYRAKTTTEETEVQEPPGQALQRLKTNPFLSSIFLTKESTSVEDEKEQSQAKRGSRLRPIVVLPDQSDSDIKTDSSVKHVEQLTLAQYSGPSNRLLYHEVPMRTRQRISNLAKHLNSEGVESMHIVVRRSAGSEQNGTEKINVAAAGTTTEIPVDTEKYPFYYSPASVSFPKYSPLRYATSPKDIPSKTEGGMEFYESRDEAVRCEEPTPPKNIVPKRGKDGEWNKNPQPEKQRLGKLGDQIDCLKAKYFGEDPLDNPFFKETDVGVPDFTTQSPDDSFGFYSDILKNIKSNPESNGNYIKSFNNKREVSINSNKPNNAKVASAAKMENSKWLSPGTRSKGANINNRLKNLESYYDESRITSKVVSQKNQNKPSRISKDSSNNEEKTVLANQTNDFLDKTTIPPFSEIQTGSSGPIRLHPPKNVIISFRSKGTSNHPRIKLIKGTASLYNVNVKIVPMSTVGYLKAHPPIHIHVEEPLQDEKSQYFLEPFYELDPISSAASKIAKQKKTPTTVTYLTMNPEGKLIHQHIRTFVPVSQKKHKEKENTPEALESERVVTLWDLHLNDGRKSDTKYRVKRNHENDKYINSKESLELKNSLLQKYAEILAKEKEEANRRNSDHSNESNRNYNLQGEVPIQTSRNTEAFTHRHRLPYSSRYRASGLDPMHESPSTEVKVSDLGNSTQQTSQTNSFRKPKVRFPKLTMNSKPVMEGNRTKFLNLSEPISVRVITTTTTTTTEPPPSTTTRMYKPRVVYKKEYGKPIHKVVDMFAVLKRQPNLNTEEPTTESTEHEPEVVEHAPKSGRRFNPKRLQQFEHRTITKEEVIRRTYSPQSDINSRSDKARAYDSIYDHPDLRGPVSRISRDTLQEDYQEMLVYMVNPTTGVGEWTVMPIPAKAISRMDDSFGIAPQNRNNKHSRGKGKPKSRVRSNRENSELSVPTTIEPTYNEQMPDIVQEIAESTPKKHKSKSRRHPSNRRHKNKVYLNSSQLRNSPVSENESREATTIDGTISTPAATHDTAVPTDDSPTSSTTTLNPKIIMEPHKRKYFYAKI